MHSNNYDVPPPFHSCTAWTLKWRELCTTVYLSFQIMKP